jgi:hypothetical protein
MKPDRTGDWSAFTLGKPAIEHTGTRGDRKAVCQRKNAYLVRRFIKVATVLKSQPETRKHPS